MKTVIKTEEYKEGDHVKVEWLDEDAFDEQCVMEGTEGKIISVTNNSILVESEQKPVCCLSHSNDIVLIYFKDILTIEKYD